MSDFSDWENSLKKRGYEWIVIGTETGKRKGKVDANPE